jgi:hypothetical protein
MRKKNKRSNGGDMETDDFLDELDEYIGQTLAVKILPKMTNFEMKSRKAIIRKMLRKRDGNRLLLYARGASGAEEIDLYAIDRIDKQQYGSRLLNTYTISYELIFGEYSIFLTIKE